MTFPSRDENSAGLSRRDWLRWSGLAGVTAVAAPSLTGSPQGRALPRSSQGVPKPSDGWMPLNRFPRMMQDFLVGRVRAVEQAQNERRAAMRTRAEAETYVRSARDRIQQSLGPFPEKTPLNARITGVLERDTYRVEKLIFESRPDFPVTANLYVPKRAGRLPAVVGACGHTSNGKVADVYQVFCQALARQGYVTLIYDPTGQGERLQYVTPDFQPRHGRHVDEHLYAGNQQFLVGESLASWYAWDAIRAIDYLVTRPEVDPRHIGITGSSGGGNVTAWVCGTDPRVTMAAPSCFITTLRRNLENELPSDTEQYPPRAHALGIDLPDFIAACAPTPVMLLGQERDFFDVRGLREGHERLRRLYALLGAEDRIGLTTGPLNHSFSKVLREAMYRWFNHITGISEVNEEPAVVLEKEQDLWCTPNGHVAAANPKTIFSHTRDASVRLRATRGRVTGPALRQAVQAVLKLPVRRGAPEFAVLRRSVPRRDYPMRFAGAYAVETEAPAHAIVYRLDTVLLEAPPPRVGGRALLYVSHQSADAELRDEPLIPELMAAEPNSAVFTCDVRGIGESQPDTCDKGFLHPYGPDYCYAMHGIMLDYPYLGQKTHDVLRVIDWLEACGHDEVHLVGRGWGALPATFAALLSPVVAQVTLKHALTSYADVAEAEDYDWPLAQLPPDVLKHFDLPDCYAALAAKRLRQIEPWGAHGVPV